MENTDIIHAVGIVVIKDSDVLMVKRAKLPKAGAWSIPGGRIEPGETYSAAAHRELFEETGLRVDALITIETVIAQFDGKTYHLHDYAAVYQGGDIIAGDDALDASFMSPADLARHNIWDKTIEIINKAKHRLGVSKTGDGN